MKPKDEQNLIDELTSDAADAGAWELDEPPARDARRRLGAQLSVRLDADHAERLRGIAERHGIGYTSLVRSWIEERIDSEASPAVAAPIRVSPGAGDSRIDEPVQITGSAWLVAVG